MKKLLKSTKTKIILILILPICMLIGLFVFANSQDSKAEYPYSLQKTLYAYTSDVDAEPSYEVKVVLYLHPDRLYAESYVEYYSNGILVKSEKIR